MAYIAPNNTKTLRRICLEETTQPIIPYKKNTVLNFIHNNPDTSNFYNIIKLAHAEYIFNDMNITVFLPDNTHCVYQNMNKVSALEIIYKCIIPEKIPMVLLTSSYALKIPTLYDKYYVETKYDNYNGLLLNNNTRILKSDIQCNNGVIHQVTNIL